MEMGKFLILQTNEDWNFSYLVIEAYMLIYHKRLDNLLT